MRGPLTLAFLLPVLLNAQTSLLRVRAVGSGGAAHAAGSRSAGITVEVTDELGKPVSGAVVTVRMPDDGPSGSFASGLSSAIITTGQDGRASTAPIAWNRLPGTAEIRITAISGKLRAGTIAAYSLSEPAPEAQAAAPEPEAYGPRIIVKQHPASVGRGGVSHKKWILIGVATAGAAVATLGLRRGGSSSGGGQSGQTGAVTSITPTGQPVVGPHP